MISFGVPIRPRPTPRPRAKKGQRAYFPADYQAYKTELEWLIKKAWLDAGKPQIDPPYQIHMLFGADHIDITVVSTTVERHGLRGDVDNMYKGVADALEAVGVIGNDRQVHEAHIGFA